MTRPTQYSPQSDYLATRAQLMGDAGQKTLMYLYQPLVGAVASALYQTLWTQVKVHPQFTRDRQPHSRLLQTLGCDMESLYDARLRLEAVGLMKTYTQVDTARHYVYELYAPLPAASFFAEDLLSIALYDAVGPDEYARLSSAFTVTPVRRADMQELTRNFMDVFHIASSLVDVPEEVLAAREVTTPPVQPLPQITGDVVDWPLLARLLEKQGLRHDAISNQREFLAQIAGFYGLSTTQLARVAQQGIDELTGTFDAKQIRRAAEKAFSAQSALHRQDAKAPAKPVSSTNQPAITLTEAEQTMLQKAKTMSAREFLSYRKAMRNARLKPQDNEIHAVESLVKQNTLDVATINVLVDYVLQDHPGINKAFLGAVSTRWIDAGVDSPESAIAQIRQYQSSGGKSGQRRSYGKPKRVEKQPSWAQPGYEAPKKTLTADERAALNAKIAGLKRPRSEEKS